MWNTLAVVVLSLLTSGEARPSSYRDVPRAVSFQDVDSFVVGGEDAVPGAWPWQLSQERFRETGIWSHSCGASLLAARHALSAAHCVDGASVTVLRVIAGLHDRTDLTGTQMTGVYSYIFHEGYADGSATFGNDIAILTLSVSILPRDNIAYARLPANNNDDFAGKRCIITGWGRNSVSNVLPNVLQQGEMEILSLDRCRMEAWNGAGIWAGHICLKSPQENIIACNGDSGGPANCADALGYVVVGIASFVTVNSITTECLPSYPTGYTRVSAYLDWIAKHT
jgi:secreted trypsin-like serine protease